MNDPAIIVLATRSPNQLLVRDARAGVELFIDFGFTAGQIDRLDALCARHGTPAARVGAVLMTHAHGDHLSVDGLSEFLRRRPAGAPPLPFYVHRDEPLPDALETSRAAPIFPETDPSPIAKSPAKTASKNGSRTHFPGLEVRRFGDEPFDVAGRAGRLRVEPVRMSHTAGSCGFRVGDDFVGCDASLDEVFSGRVLECVDPPGGRPVRSLYLDMESLDRESILRANVGEARRQVMLTSHGIASDMAALLARPDLRRLFAGLERLVCLHVTPEVNDATGRANARVISDARDRLGFSFDVPIVPAGIQE